MSSPAPITIHIPPSMAKYAKPASEYIAGDPESNALCVSGIVMAMDEKSRAHVLLIKRANEGYKMDGQWECPGGGCEAADPTLIHSTAREVYEEAGLHLTSVKECVAAYTFKSTHGFRCLKLNFLIETQEIRRPMKLADIPVEIDPKEHSAYEWVPESDLGAEHRPITSEDQLLAIRAAFKAFGRGSAAGGELQSQV